MKKAEDESRPKSRRTMPGKNGGTLTVGGTQGGRPPSKLRAEMRGALADRLHIAGKIADSKDSSDSDRLRALDFLAKYGLGTTITETDTDGNHVARVVEVPTKDGLDTWIRRGKALTNGNGANGHHG